jgi:uncharacterized membrane protein
VATDLLVGLVWWLMFRWSLGTAATAAVALVAGSVSYQLWMVRHPEVLERARARRAQRLARRRGRHG